MATANPTWETINQYRPKIALATAETRKHTNAPITNVLDEKRRRSICASFRQYTSLLPWADVTGHVQHSSIGRRKKNDVIRHAGTLGARSLAPKVPALLKHIRFLSRTGFCNNV